MDQEVKVSEVQIIPVKPKDGLVAFTSFVLDDRYYVSSVAVFTTLEPFGYRLAYPTKKVGTKNINIFHPINSEVGLAITKAITNKVNEVFNDDLSKDYA